MGLGQKVKDALELGTDAGKRDTLPGSYPSETDLTHGTTGAAAAGMSSGSNPFPNPGAAPGVTMPSTSTERHGAEPPVASDAQLKESHHNKLHKSNDPRGYTEPHHQSQTTGPYILTDLPEPNLAHKHEHHHKHHDDTTGHHEHKHHHDDKTAHQHSSAAPQQTGGAMRSHQHTDSAVDVDPLHSHNTRNTTSGSSDPVTGGKATDTPYWGDIQPGQSQHRNDHHTLGGAGTAAGAGLGAGAAAGLAQRHAAGGRDDQSRTTDLNNPNQSTSGGVYNTVTGHGSSEDPSSKFYVGTGNNQREFPLSQRAKDTPVVAGTQSTSGYDPSTTTAGQKYDSNPTDTGYDPTSTASRIANDPRTNLTGANRFDRDAPSSSQDHRHSSTAAAGIGAGAGLAATEAARRHHEHEKDDIRSGRTSQGGAAPTSTSTSSQPTQQVRSMLDPTTTSTTTTTSTSTSTGPHTGAATGTTGTSGVGSRGDGYQHLASGTASGIDPSSTGHSSGGHDTARAAAAGAGAAGLGYAAGSAANRDHQSTDPKHTSTSTTGTGGYGTSTLGGNDHPRAAVRSDAAGTSAANPLGTSGTTTTSGHGSDPNYRDDKDHSRTAAAAGAGGLAGAGMGYYASQMRDKMHGDHTNDPSQRSTGPNTTTTSGTTGSGVAPPSNLGGQSGSASAALDDINQRSAAAAQPGHDSSHSSRGAGLGAAGAGAGLGAAAAHHHNKDHTSDPSHRSGATTTSGSGTGSDPYNHLGSGTASGVHESSPITAHTGHDNTARNAGLGAGAGAAGLGAAAAASHHKGDRSADPTQRSTGTSSGGKDDGYNHLASGTPSGVHIEPKHHSSSSHDQSSSHPTSGTSTTGTGAHSSGPHVVSGSDTTGTKDRSYAGPAAGAATGAALGAGAAHHYSSQDKRDPIHESTTTTGPSSGLGDQTRSRHVGSSTDPYSQTQTSSVPGAANYGRDSSHGYLSNTDGRSGAAPAAAAAAMRGSNKDSAGSSGKVTHTCTSCGAENDITSKIKEAMSSFSSK